MGHGSVVRAGTERRRGGGVRERSEGTMGTAGPLTQGPSAGEVQL